MFTYDQFFTKYEFYFPPKKSITTKKKMFNQKVLPINN